jgi:sugar lactone lactonase YvrE
LCLTSTFAADSTSAADNTSPKITLEEVLSVGSLENDTLFQWVGVAVDPHGQIYVTDAMDYSLKKFDADGKLMKKAGRKGQGPGEFLAPRLLVRSDDYLFVTDQSLPGIQVFDHDLNFIRRIPIKIPIGDVKVLSDDRIAVVALVLNQSGCIHVYDYRGQMLKQFKYTEKQKSSMMDWVEIDFDSEGNLYVVYNFQDRIEKFDANGGRLWSRSYLDIKKVKTKKVGPWEVPDKIVFKDIVFDSDERLYVLGGGHSKNPSRDVYVLNRDGEILATFTLPESSHCLYIDLGNFLYTRANDGITLKKYRIKWPNI